jgi:hypothetical protein
LLRPDCGVVQIPMTFECAQMIRIVDPHGAHPRPWRSFG